MHRGRSALVSPQTRVTIDGKSFAVPVQIEAAGRPIAMKGYVTEQHHMAALRAGTMELELVDSPRASAVGERWSYAVGDDRITFSIVAAGSDGLRVVRSDRWRVEFVRANVTDDGLELAELVVRDVDSQQHLARLSFKASAFSIAIDDAYELLTGSLDVLRATGSESVLRLLPEEPAWARARPVAVTLKQVASRLSISTSIG